LKLTRYFGQLDRNMVDVQAPDPHEIIDYIQEQHQWEPNLTETFASRYNLRALLGVHSRAAALHGFIPILSAASSTSGLTVSGVTFPTKVGGGTSSTATTAEKGISLHVKNAQFNKALFGSYKASALKAKAIRDKIKAGTIPSLPFSIRDGTKPMCLAWHTKGVCNANCPCAYNHVAYSVEEYASMVAWCRNHGYAAS
jgi:hypothetical protein